MTLNANHHRPAGTCDDSGAGRIVVTRPINTERRGTVARSASDRACGVC